MAPLPPRVSRAPELVGPEGSREDVSDKTDRSLIVRVVDWQLHFEHTFGPIMRELSELRVGHADHERRIVTLELGPMRKAEASYHDFSEELQRADATLRARIKDKRDPMTSERARELAKEVVKATGAEGELATWRTVKSWPAWLLRKGAEHLVTLLVGGGAVLLWHYLSSR